MALAAGTANRDDDEEAHPLAGVEGEALVGSAWRSRQADRELALALDRPEPSGAAATARYLDDLSRRPSLPAVVERDLIAAAQAGDAVARGRLVEAFMPLVASVARVYRDS